MTLKADLPAAQARRAIGAVVKFSVAIAGHRTSVSLEQAFWLRLNTVAAARGCTLPRLVADIDAQREAATNLSSAIRVWLLQEALQDPVSST